MRVGYHFGDLIETCLPQRPGKAQPLGGTVKLPTAEGTCQNTRIEDEFQHRVFQRRAALTSRMAASTSSPEIEAIICVPGSSIPSILDRLFLVKENVLALPFLATRFDE